MKKLKIPELQLKRIGLIAIFVLLFFLLMDLNTRLGELNRLSAQRDVLASEVTSLAATRDLVQTQIVFSGSDAAVEKWAREQAHMVKPGDKLIVPIPPSDATLVPTPIPTQVFKPVSNWKIWWELFFGN